MLCACFARVLHDRGLSFTFLEYSIAVWQDLLRLVQNPCNILQDHLRLVQNPCNIMQDLLTLGQNSCNILQDLLRLVQNPCNILQDRRPYGCTKPIRLHKIVLKNMSSCQSSISLFEEIKESDKYQIKHKSQHESLISTDVLKQS